MHTDTPSEPATESTAGPTTDSFGLVSIRRFVDRHHENVVTWHEYTVGGRYVTNQAPDVLVADLRGCGGNLLAEEARARLRCAWFRYAVMRAGTTPRRVCGRLAVSHAVSGRRAAGTGC